MVELRTGGTEKVLLLKPLTYMNLSGKAVQAAMSFFQLTPGDIVIVLDDLALPCGRLRLRGSGSSGGHNGLKDIERVLGTNEYPRLRIGIDPAPPRIRGKGLCAGKIHHRAAKVARSRDRSGVCRDPDVDRQRNRPRDEPVQRGGKGMTHRGDAENAEKKNQNCFLCVLRVSAVNRI